MSLKNLIIAIVLGSALASGIFVASQWHRPPELQTAFVIPEPQALPAFSLLDQHGQAVTADVFRGQWDLVFFGFTHCPDICPLTLQLLASVKKELQDAGMKTLPRIVLVSVDPERDTPDLMRQYVDYFGAGNLAITGDLDGIRALTAALGVYFAKAPTDDGNYSVDHSAAVLVVNPDAEFAALFSAPHTVENFVHDLPLLMSRQ